MESSYSEDEEDRSSVQRRSQMDRLAREEAFYRFVSNLSEEDYKLMRDNNLLATVGESTEEELMRRLQQIKEHPPQELGEGNSSESMSSDDSILQWLTTFRQTENMTEWEQGDNQSWTSASSSNSSSSDFGCSGEMNFNPLNGNPNRQNGHLTFASLLEGQYIENRQRQVEYPPSESTDTSSSISEENATEAFTEVPPSRGQRRSRSRSPETRRTRPRIESSSPSNRQHEIFHYYTSPETFEYILINEPGIFSRIQPSGAVREQITRPELQSQDLLSASATRNAFQEEYSSDTVSDNESEGFRQRYPTTLFDDEVTNHPGEYSLRNSIASRTQLISETTNNTVTLESYQEELRNRFSPFEQESMRSSVNTIIIPAPIANETTLWHMTEFDESSELMDSESQLESSSSPLSQHMEKEESQNGRDDSSSSIISSSNSNPSCDSQIISVMFDGFNEINTSSSSPSQPRQESQYTTPATSDESDSWPFLAHFFILNEAHNQPTGLTKQQIDNFAVRNFGKDGALKACSICLTEFKESNKIRILPCSHEYHIHCIDRWLSENSTCPVCRRELTDSDGRKNSS
uniref:RING-type E3 ubiquitin transferase n=1 Tax=Sciurus vulgaris TaxID=55149 RepID=A0A8D2CW18_SCIVU